MLNPEPHAQDGGEWIERPGEYVMMIRGLRVVGDRTSYKQFGHNPPENVHLITMNGMVDTGVGIMVISLIIAQKLGVKKSEMMAVNTKITMIKGYSMNIMGGILIKTRNRCTML